MDTSKSSIECKGPKYIKALLDRSGSMITNGLSDALVEGINTLILEQKNTSEMYGTNPTIDIYSFDNEIEQIRSTSIKTVENITKEES